MIPAIIRFFLDIPGDISTNEKYMPTKCTYTQAGIQDFRVCVCVCVCVWEGGGVLPYIGYTVIYAVWGKPLRASGHCDVTEIHLE